MYYPVDGNYSQTVEGFLMQTPDAETLRRLGLLNKGLLHLLNGLAVIVDDTSTDVPTNDWIVCADSLRSLISDYDNGPLYSHVIGRYGPEAINLNLWMRFVLRSGWSVTVRAYKDMPTEVLESHGLLWWRLARIGADSKAKRKVFNAIGQRTDTYGAHSLPTDLAVGILFEEGGSKV